MKIQVKNIPAQGISLTYQKEFDEFIVLKELVERGECRFIEPIAIELAVEPERETIKVSGFFKTAVELPCSRCLTAFTFRLQRDFTMRYARGEDIAADRFGDEPEIELTAEQIGLSYYEDDEINFKDVVQEQIVLALPFKPLCREDCKGLCPHCGTDLNQGRCECAEEQTRNPFAVLKERSWPKRNIGEES